jgi:hypothetical protein
MFSSFLLGRRRRGHAGLTGSFESGTLARSLGIRDPTGESVPSLEGNADFDQGIIVYYAGIQFFGEMVQSEFYTGIFDGKRLSDDLSSLTVPRLPHF